MPQPEEAATTAIAETTTTGTTDATADTLAAVSSPLTEFGEAIEAKLRDWVPFYADSPLLQGASILVFFLLLASLASFFLKRVAAQLLSKTETDLDDKILSALTGPIYITMLSAGLRLALARVGLDDSGAGVVSSLLASAVIISWLIAASKIAKALLTSMGNTRHFGVLREDTLPLFENLTTIAVGILGVYFLVVAWGGNLSGLLTLGGVGGLVIGLAAKDTIGNVFAGMFIFADSPYKVGDYINLDSGERGKVTDIGIRSTRLLTRDDVEIIIPNSVISGAKIVNETGGPDSKYRIRIPVGVAYGTDIDLVNKTLLEVAASEPLAESDPAPRVRMRGFGDSSLDFELLCWVSEPELRGRALDALFGSVYKRFGQENIEIPFVKRDLYIKEMPSSFGGGTSGAA